MTIRGFDMYGKEVSETATITLLTPWERFVIGARRVWAVFVHAVVRWHYCSVVHDMDHGVCQVCGYGDNPWCEAEMTDADKAQIEANLERRNGK